MIAHFGIYYKLSVLYRGGVYGTGVFYLADLAASALGQIRLGKPLSDNSHIVKVRLYAVVGTAAYRKLEFMRKGYIVVSDIEQVMKLPA